MEKELEQFASIFAEQILQQTTSGHLIVMEPDEFDKIPEEERAEHTEWFDKAVDPEHFRCFWVALRDGDPRDKKICLFRNHQAVMLALIKEL